MNYTEQLMNEISHYNKQYRIGKAEITDQEYDSLLDKLSEFLSPEEFTSFQETLMEEKGTNKFNYKVGSLKKIKYETPEELYKWIKKENIKQLFISEKINGCSCVLEYEKGKLTKASTKGDGTLGTDITNKVLLIPSVPKKITYKHDIHIRGELVLHNNEFAELNYSTALNGSIGMINSDEIHPNISKLNFYAYEVITEKWFIERQFEFLQQQGFYTPNIIYFDINLELHNRLKDFYLACYENSAYGIDGLVCSSPNYIPELDKHIPSKKIAFKVNNSSVPTKVIDIEWNVSKGRLIKPTLIVEEVTIKGRKINRVKGNNANYLFDSGLGIGAEVGVIFSGQIIPRIIDIYKSVSPIIPLTCPDCNGNLGYNNVDLICVNESCGEVKRIVYFLQQLEIKNVAVKRLVEWGINTFDDLLNWKYQIEYKSQFDFNYQLNQKLFKASPEKIMRSFSCKNLGTTNFDKLLNALGSLDKMSSMIKSIRYNVVNFDESVLPDNIGIRTIQNACNDWYDNEEIFKKIISDTRYSYIPQIKVETKEKTMNKLSGKTFLITGKMSMVRTEMENVIRDNGGSVASGVSRNLNYLIAGPDQWGNSTKFTKAENLGIDIITEEEFIEMIG